jgi:ubiquinone/menaquinone biosynthesis C-methylase UbiE
MTDSPTTTFQQPCSGSGWRSQFCLPTGVLGWLVGHLMAFKNRERGEWVLSQLDVRGNERVLEIGFGPGTDVRRAAAHARHVSGVDPSAVMLSQARRRNQRAIAAGCVDLRLGAMPALPFQSGRFDKAFSINTFQFWPDKIRGLQELKRVMKPGGIVAIAVQPRNAGATEVTAHETGQQIATALAAAGFSDLRLAFKQMKPVSTACVTAKA